MPSSKAPPDPHDRAAAAVLAHIARRVREFDHRLELLEAAGRPFDTAGLHEQRRAAEALGADIRRLRAAAALLHLHFQLRREQLAASPEPEPTTMETY